MAKVYVTQAGGSGGSVATGVLQLSGGAAMSSTLTAVTDQNNTASPLKLSTTAVQVVSPLRVTTDDPSDMYLDLEDGSANNRFNITRNTASQQVNLNFASNPGGSTTVVGAIRTYVDGVNLSEVMAFREDGNIGIGTTTPGAKLDVHASVNVIAQFNRTGAGKSWIQFLQAGAGKWNVGYDNTNGNYTIYDVVNSTDRMVVTNSGNVGIGTNAPTQLLQVARNANSTTNVLVSNSDTTNTSSRASFTANSGGVIGQLVAISGDDVYVGAAASNVRIGANGGTDILVSTTGNVSVGSTTNLGARLGIKGSGSTSATTSLLVQNSGGSNIIKTTDDGLTFIGNITTGSTGANDTLQIQGNTSVKTSVGTLVFRAVPSSNDIYFDAPSGGIFFRTNGTNQAMSINASQAIGIGVSSANASALLDLTSTTRGFLAPRMTNAQRLAIATPAVGLMVYCTDAVEGLYVYKSTGWTFVI